MHCGKRPLDKFQQASFFTRAVIMSIFKAAVAAAKELHSCTTAWAVNRSAKHVSVDSNLIQGKTAGTVTYAGKLNSLAATIIIDHPLCFSKSSSGSNQTAPYICCSLDEGIQCRDCLGFIPSVVEFDFKNGFLVFHSSRQCPIRPWPLHDI